MGQALFVFLLVNCLLVTFLILKILLLFGVVFFYYLNLVRHCLLSSIPLAFHDHSLLLLWTPLVLFLLFFWSFILLCEFSLSSFSWFFSFHYLLSLSCFSFILLSSPSLLFFFPLHLYLCGHLFLLLLFFHPFPMFFLLLFVIVFFFMVVFFCYHCF